MNTRSGFTLLEVVVSLVILSAITAVALPLLLQAQRVLRAPGPAVELWELAQVADNFLQDPSGELDEVRTLTWPQRPDLAAIGVEWRDDDLGRWVTFEWGDLTLARWQPPKQEDGEDDSVPAGSEVER